MRLEQEIEDKDLVRVINTPMIPSEITASLLGKRIGYGSFREVYEYALDSKYVVKVERDNGHANISEYLLWEEIKGLRGSLDWVSKWFAPIKWISPGGRIMLMRKTIKKNKPYPKQVPAFFSDIATRNWGWIGDKFVCHDYQFIHKFIKYEKKMQKVKWF